jgi:hypothetical protein
LKSVKNIEKLKFLGKSTLVLVVVLVFNILASNLAEEHIYWSSASKATWNLNQKNETVDVLVIGGSKAYNCVNTDLLNKLNPNLQFINCGIPQLSIADQYCFLQALKTNDLRFKSVLLVVDPAQFLKDDYHDQKSHLHYFTPFLANNSIFKAQAVSTGFIETLFGRFFPTFSLIANRPIYNQLDNKNIPFSQTGYSALTGTGNFDLTELNASMGNMNIVKNQNNISYLSKIISESEADGIEIILVTLPNQSAYKSTIEALPEMKDAQHYLTNLAQETGLIYLNLNDSLTVADNLFADPLHLNKEGSVIATKELSFALYN